MTLGSVKVKRTLQAEELIQLLQLLADGRLLRPDPRPKFTDRLRDPAMARDVVEHFEVIEVRNHRSTAMKRESHLQVQTP